MPADTRDRILETTAELFRRYGYTGTGLKQIVAERERPVRLALPLLPRREGAARRRGRSAGRATCTASCSSVFTARRPTSATGGRGLLRRRRRDAACRRTTPTPARSPPSPSRWPARASRSGGPRRVFESWIGGGHGALRRRRDRRAERAAPGDSDALLPWRAPSCSAGPCAAPSRWRPRARAPWARSTPCSPPVCRFAPLARTQFFGAASLDGFIATPDGGIDWLRSYDDAGRDLYEDFIAGVGALAMGAATYDSLLEQLGSAAWPYEEQPTWVFTHRRLEAPEGADVRFVEGPVSEAHAEMRAAAGDAQRMGGGRRRPAQPVRGRGAGARLGLTVVPVVLGAGVPLFPRAVRGALELTGTSQVGGGLVELRYARPAPTSTPAPARLRLWRTGGIADTLGTRLRKDSDPPCRTQGRTPRTSTCARYSSRSPSSPCSSRARSWPCPRAQPPHPRPRSTADRPAPTARAPLQFSLSSPSPGAHFECRLDSGAWSACSANPAFDVANGSHKLEVRATLGNQTDPTPAERTWWADATVQNGNFETAGDGWLQQGYVIPGWKTDSSNTTLSVVSGGAGGEKAGRATAVGAGSLSTRVAPRPVNAAAAGTQFTASGMVRSAPGARVCLRVREWSPADAPAPTPPETQTPPQSVLGAAESCVNATSSWQAFAAVDYTTTGAGSEIDVYAYRSTTASAGDWFELDTIALRDTDPLAVPPTPEVTGDPVLLGLGDIASCWSAGDEATARLLDSTPGVIGIVGDTEQNNGTTPEFNGLLRLDLGAPQRPQPAGRGRPRVPRGGRHRVLRLLREPGRAAPEGVVQLRPRRLAHRGPEQQLRPDRWLRPRLRAVRVAPAGSARERRGLRRRLRAPPALERRSAARQPDPGGPLLGRPVRVQRRVRVRRERPHLPALRASDPGGPGGPGEGAAPVRARHRRHAALPARRAEAQHRGAAHGRLRRHALHAPREQLRLALPLAGRTQLHRLRLHPVLAADGGQQGTGHHDLLGPGRRDRRRHLGELHLHRARLNLRVPARRGIAMDRLHLAARPRWAGLRVPHLPGARPGCRGEHGRDARRAHLDRGRGPAGHDDRVGAVRPRGERRGHLRAERQRGRFHL